MPASFKLGQEVFSSWQRPWKFSCSKRAIWEGEKRGCQSLWGAPDQEEKESSASGPVQWRREQDGFCLPQPPRQRVFSSPPVHTGCSPPHT